MTPEQAQLVVDSWQQIKPASEQAANTFYHKLFELDPELETLFKSDMQTQGAKLMAMIDVAVNSLNDLDGINADLKALGQRHVEYGVKDKDYVTVGTALLWMLQQNLGDDFTPEVKYAWAAVYGALAKTMTTV
jgi:hemoglobin-like flavoprotein